MNILIILHESAGTPVLDLCIWSLIKVVITCCGYGSIDGFIRVKMSIVRYTK